jgi:hypothetical protein
LCSGTNFAEGSISGGGETLLRERFKARCLERAQKARERAVKGKRWDDGSDRSSDGFDEAMDCGDEEDGDDMIMGDEVC